MPLVKYVSNASPEDRTSAIRLSDDSDGLPREIVLDGPAVDVSGEELRAMAANGFQIEFIEAGSAEDDSQKPVAQGDAWGEAPKSADPVPPASPSAQSLAGATIAGEPAAVTPLSGAPSAPSNAAPTGSN